MAQIQLPLRAFGMFFNVILITQQADWDHVDTQEASMADISYLFEEGALVDFEVDELVRLVKALFADTPLRANTINKLMNGHPVPSSS